MSDIPFDLKNNQDFDEIGRQFARFCKVIAALRDPDHGCPWDLEQSFETLRSYMLEEAWEASLAMKEGNGKEISGELGDVLLQVVLNAQLGRDQNLFSIMDVITSVLEKMIRRHPHVFGGDDEKNPNKSVSDIRKTWEEIKADEAALSESVPVKKEKGYFEKAKAHKIFPASTQALKIGRLAADINFDWKSPQPVFETFLSEVRELEAEWNQGNIKDQDRFNEELGDLYFSLAQVCRHQKLDPELIAMEGNHKFLRRFKKLESLAKEENIAIEKSSQETLETLWQKVKTLEKQEPKN